MRFDDWGERRDGLIGASGAIWLGRFDLHGLTGAARVERMVVFGVYFLWRK